VQIVTLQRRDAYFERIVVEYLPSWWRAEVLWFAKPDHSYLHLTAGGAQEENAARAEWTEVGGRT